MILISIIGNKFPTLVAKFVLDFMPQFDMPRQIFVSDLNATHRTSFFGHQSIFGGAGVVGDLGLTGTTGAIGGI